MDVCYKRKGNIRSNVRVLASIKMELKAADVPYDSTKKTRKTQDRQKEREDHQRQRTQ